MAVCGGVVGPVLKADCGLVDAIEHDIAIGGVCVGVGSVAQGASQMSYNITGIRDISNELALPKVADRTSLLKLV